MPRDAEVEAAPSRSRLDCFDGARQGLAIGYLYGCDADPGEADATHAKKLRATKNCCASLRKPQHRADHGARTRPGEQMIFVAGYVATLVAFVAADMVWLGIMVDRVYRPAIGDLLSPSVNVAAAAVFYLIFPGGLTIFAVVQAVQNQSAGNAAVLGGLFGFFAYSTYDLTNQATLRNWPTRLTVIDLAWGSVLAAFAATIGYIAASRF
jgi:uncharacterized membrane protein